MGSDAVGDEVAVAPHLVARQVADGHARRDSRLARHDRHGRREVHAVARAHAEELPHDVDAAAVVALLDGRVLRVAELPAREELLQRERLVVGRVDAREHVGGRRGDDGRGAVGDLQVGLEVVVGRGGDGLQLRAFGSRQLARHGVALVAAVGVGGTDREALLRPAPRALEPGDAAGRVGRGQPGARGALDLHAGLDLLGGDVRSGSEVRPDLVDGVPVRRAQRRGRPLVALEARERRHLEVERREGRGRVAERLHVDGAAEVVAEVEDRVDDAGAALAGAGRRREGRRGEPRDDRGRDEGEDDRTARERARGYERRARGSRRPARRGAARRGRRREPGSPEQARSAPAALPTALARVGG
ncbi:hypothetical protein CMMCAS03_05245 [Clavibacter michiganensis subsp. michiganensis]|nr:hypothetical protein CMMCAS03_05245 [Clavibacter michiganensis subsp. michiganensis]